MLKDSMLIWVQLIPCKSLEAMQIDDALLSFPFEALRLQPRLQSTSLVSPYAKSRHNKPKQRCN